MNVEWPQFAAVVSSRDLEDPRSAGGDDAGRHGVLDGRQIHSVDYDLINRVGALG